MEHGWGGDGGAAERAGRGCSPPGGCRAQLLPKSEPGPARGRVPARDPISGTPGCRSALGVGVPTLVPPKCVACPPTGTGARLPAARGVWAPPLPVSCPRRCAVGGGFVAFSFFLRKTRRERTRKTRHRRPPVPCVWALDVGLCRGVCVLWSHTTGHQGHTECSGRPGLLSVWEPSRVSALAARARAREPRGQQRRPPHASGGLCPAGGSR